MSTATSKGHKTLAISVSPRLYEDLESRAREAQVSVSEYLRGSVALRRYVEDRWVLLPWPSRRWDVVLMVCANRTVEDAAISPAPAASADGTGPPGVPGPGG